ncbi:MAG: recombination mediator RecR [Patescibacteria group bacterium]|jgi:recombination protein RecR
MARFPFVIQRLIERFTQLPGVGPKTAERYIYTLLKLPKSEREAMADAISDLSRTIATCVICFDFAEKSPCNICGDANRSDEHLCVVAESSDLHALERSGAFAGKYHILGGVLRPTAGITPERLTVDALEKRIKEKKVQELIIALDPTMEGEATTQYLTKRFTKLGIRMTRLARGLPMGADIAYADDQTLENAFARREELTASRPSKAN